MPVDVRTGIKHVDIVNTSSILLANLVPIKLRTYIVV